MGFLARFSERMSDSDLHQARAEAIAYLSHPLALSENYPNSLEEKAEVIVVGAGPAGISAAYTLARHGIQTLLLEHAKHPGANSVLGGVFYTSVLGRLDPDLATQLPMERHIEKRIFGFLHGDGKTHFAVDFSRGQKFMNSATVIRSEFDHAFAKEGVKRYGKFLKLQSATAVDEILVDGQGRAMGVRGRHNGREVKYGAQIIINAEGPNNLLTQKLRVQRQRLPHNALGLKNVYQFSSPSEVEKIFGLSGEGGAAIELTGPGAIGPYGVGGGYLYTYKSHVGAGIIAPFESILGAVHRARSSGGSLDLRPDVVLNRFFLNHGYVRNLLREANNFQDGEVAEVSKRVIPEGGFQGLNQPYHRNLLLCGDAFGTVNASIAHEGTSHACETGLLAARTLIRLREEHPGTSLRDLGADLSLYPELLWDQGVALRDIYFHDDFMKFLLGNPALLNDLPSRLIPAMTAFFSFDGRGKVEIQREILESILGAIPVRDRILTPMAVLSLARRMRFLNYSDLFC